MVVQTDKEGKKNKAQGNRRVMYTQHHPCWDAKNRYGLPEEIPMEYAQIAQIYAPVQPLETPPAPAPSTSATEVQPGIPQSLADLMAASGITEQQIRAAVAMKGYFPEDMPISAYPEDFVSGVLVGAWKQIVDFINEQKYPF